MPLSIHENVVCVAASFCFCDRRSVPHGKCRQLRRGAKDHEHALGGGEDASAAAYVEADVGGEPVWGVGIHSSIVTASLRAVVNAANRGVLSARKQAELLHEFRAS